VIGYKYTLVQVIFWSCILGFRFYSGKIKSSKNRICFKSGTIRFRFGLFMFNSAGVKLLWIGFEFDRVILGMGHFSSC